MGEWLEEHELRIAQCERRLNGTDVPAQREQYIQNTLSQAVHQIRPGTQHTTVCGWHFSNQLRLGNVNMTTTPLDVEWWLICEKCLPEIRNAHKGAACDLEQPSD